MPIILFGSKFWGGLLEWMRETLLKHGTVSESDFDLLTVTDDPDEVTEIMVKHRQWKQQQIHNSNIAKLRERFGDNFKAEWLEFLEVACGPNGITLNGN
jgi:hypothetical protein